MDRAEGASAAITAPIEWVRRTTTSGVPILVPRGSFSNDQISMTLQAVATGSAEWLTLSDAARDMQDHCPGLTHNQAKGRIHSAVESGKIVDNGLAGEERRLSTLSFQGWLLQRLLRAAQSDDEVDDPADIQRRIAAERAKKTRRLPSPPAEREDPDQGDDD